MDGMDFAMNLPALMVQLGQLAQFRLCPASPHTGD
jgi:hypothetical protein